ncbi:hypothetical protein [Nocardioides donggukensis]|uniref:Uncharacterized protein n=1 Tax=Nocardioides donggukensis TaxID=2774019 RepID=A0A927Q0R0_9ACTN|nr:hypothetical protein [Nocardioides donggukensis]MBD8868036.1 hypothetical protein [Nocardioides donggukensis]
MRTGQQQFGKYVREISVGEHRAIHHPDTETTGQRSDAIVRDPVGPEKYVLARSIRKVVPGSVSIAQLHTGGHMFSRCSQFAIDDMQTSAAIHYDVDLLDAPQPMGQKRTPDNVICLHTKRPSRGEDESLEQKASFSVLDRTAFPYSGGGGLELDSPWRSCDRPACGTIDLGFDRRRPHLNVELFVPPRDREQVGCRVALHDPGVEIERCIDTVIIYATPTLSRVAYDECGVVATDCRQVGSRGHDPGSTGATDEPVIRSLTHPSFDYPSYRSKRGITQPSCLDVSVGYTIGEEPQ